MFPKIEFEFDNNFFFIIPRFHKVEYENEIMAKYYGHRKAIWVNWLYFTINFIWEE